MGDIVDKAEHASNAFFQEALNNKAKEAPGHTGFCLNCNEEVEHPLRWCDTDCRDDWEKYSNKIEVAPGHDED